MTVRILIVLSFLLAAGPAMLAQDKKIELIPFVAYTLSEGIDFNAADIGTGQIVTKLTPKVVSPMAFRWTCWPVKTSPWGFYSATS